MLNEVAQKQTTQRQRSPMRNFLTIWFGQLVSLTGSSMIGFALGVWVFQQTGSATRFALIALFNTLPRALLSPIAGAVADRYDRRSVMLIADLGAALSTVFLMIMFATGRIEVWHIYLGTLFNASANAFQFPAYSSSIPVLVPKSQLGRANGLVQLASAVGQIVAPAAAGVLIGLVSIESIMLVDLLTFLVAVATLLVIRIPHPDTGEAAHQESFLQQIVAGFRYLVAQRGLFTLLAFVVIGNFFVGIAAVLMSPMILSFAEPQTLGILQAVGGVGLLIGGIVMSVWGGGKKPTRIFLSFYALLGLGVMGAGLQPSAIVVGIGSFLAYLSLPFVIGTLSTLINRKVEPAFQGRVVSLRMTAVMGAFTAAYATAGPLADYIFEPLLMPGGPLAGSIGQVVGVGAGRGMGFIFVVMGFFALIVVAAGFAMPRLRNLDEEIADAI